ncbi:hypothetical protein ASE14_02400 [Agromyces sp. Root81]|nr:hypothetical protein ASE14_02400 [Agromyces sp. Root81]
MGSAVLSALVLGAGLVAPTFVALDGAGTAAHALPPGPGTRGQPAAPVALFHEDFENAPDSGPSTDLVDYVSAPDGYQYTADGEWEDPVASCNGFVLSGGNDLTGLCGDSASSQGGLRNLTDVLGQVNGSDPKANSAVAAYTSGRSYAPDQVQFATDGEVIPLPAANRFVTFSVNAAATSCWAAHPEMRFSVLAGGVETPISGGGINPCTDPRAEVVAPTQQPDSPVYYGGEFASDGSFLTSGSPVGIVMRNGSGATAGNDGAFDDIRLLDVTPQLDKAFSPKRVPVGGVSTLTFTVTNTAELAAKDGWQFTDTLPDGLVVADDANVGGTCDATTTATAGGNAVTITGGKLDAGDVSCTITVDVTSDAPRGADAPSKTFENCAANIDGVVGLDLPGCASVEFYSEPKLTLQKTSDAVAPGKPGDIVTYEVTATNSGTGDYTAEHPAIVTDDLTGVLDDAAYQSDATSDRGAVTFTDPKLRWSGALPVGESVTIRYSVELGAEGDLLVRNVAFAGEPTDKTPKCDDPTDSPTPCDAVEFPVKLTPMLVIDKTSDQADGARVGDTVHYTVKVTNVGDGPYTGGDPAAFVDDMTGVLDDADYNGDATVTDGSLTYSEPKLIWNGPLAAGEYVELRYSVTLHDGGDQSVRNVAFTGLPTDQTPECADPATSDVPCDVVKYPVKPTPVVPGVPAKPAAAGLASTGVSLGVWAGIGGGILAVGLLLTLRRVRRA